MVRVVKNPSASVGDIKDESLIPGSERSPGGGHGNPPQYSCLENPIDRGAWRASPWGHRESDTTERVHTHTHTHTQPDILTGKALNKADVRFLVRIPL